MIEHDGLAGLDVFILATSAVSVILGAYRGFLREALSLVIWVGAFIIASLFGQELGSRFGTRFGDESVRFALAFGSLFLATLVLGALASRFLGLLVEATGLTGLDRLLGLAFGAARAGVLFVVLAAMLEPLFASAPWWQTSVLVPHLLAAQEATFRFLGDLAAAIGRATEA